MRFFLKSVTLFIFLCFIITVVPAQKRTSNSKLRYGFFVGGGSSRLGLKKSGWQQGTINYADSLNDVQSKGSFGLNMGLFLQFPIGESIDLRPGFIMIFGSSGKIEYQKKHSTELVNLNTISFGISIPVLLKLPSTHDRFYTSVGPCIMITPQPDGKLMPLKVFDIMADLSIGYEIPLAKFIITPEMKVMQGMLNLHENANNIYTNTISKIHRNYLGLSFYFRGK